MKIRTILPLALVAALLTGCAEDEATALDVGGEPMTFCIAQDAQTRAVNLAGNAWEGGEEVAVSIGGTVKKYVVGSDKTTLSPTSGVTPFTWSNKTETKTVTAWYPYAATKPAVTVPADQSTDAKLRDAIMLEATLSGVTYGTTAALPFTHRTAKVTINPYDADNGNVMQAAATVTLKNLSGVSSGTTVTPKKNSDNSYTAIIAPQSIAASTVFATIGYNSITWNYKPGATTFSAANAYTYNVSWSRVISYTAPTLRTGLTFNGNSSNVSGSAQNLVNAGSVTHGTIYYSTNGGSSWSTSLPKGTNAGSYTVHYKVEPDAGYSGGVGSTSLGSTTIAKSNGWVTLSSYSSTGWNTAKRKEVTITATHHGGTLTGSSPTSFISVSVSGNNVTITKLRLVSADPPRNITITSAATTNYNAASATYTCNQ